MYTVAPLFKDTPYKGHNTLKGAMHCYEVAAG